MYVARQVLQPAEPLLSNGKEVFYRDLIVILNHHSFTA